MDNKPSSIEVIGHHVELRKAGHRWRGLCPFHSEKNPSFFVDEPGYCCFGCGAKGDVIDFVMKFHGIGFREALAQLGIDGYKPKPRNVLKERGAAIMARWMNQQHARVGAMLRQLSRNIAIAQEVHSTTLIDRWEREFSVLEVLFEDLQKPEYASELFAAKDSIEAITAQAPVEPLMEFPAWTPDYAAYLATHLPKEQPC